jgi:hypothetical protein
MASPKADLGREVVVIDQQGPASLLSTFKGAKAIRREAKRDITGVVKISVGEFFVVDRNTCVAKSLVMFSIENVLRHIDIMTEICAIAHLLGRGRGRALIKCLQTGD